ncbi:hypothetical protein N7468_008020 [Penicillium chermesinum]|uniref:Thioredoxin-like fold domain-containing protein n=1 Tax=Penicillium chermesinum TaxID=63820 RepID=A0A9W9NRA8_9EURO|nr:uncharacterized protein N7468_008020 [Penicillium chermesinum]KAJ5223478.1 hypothetical protein N7468_008020 [Penicillium chermesinum]
MSTTPMSTITVFGGFPEDGQYVWSPFVTKLEARLRFAAIPYRVQAGSIPNVLQGKIPYVTIETASGKETFADSDLAIKELICSGRMNYLNGDLTGTEKLQDLSLQALLEDKLYTFQGYERWVANYTVMRDKTFESVPLLMRIILGKVMYKKQMRTLKGQGMGKFTPDENLEIRREIWDMLAQTIEASYVMCRGEEPFWVWGGDEPTEADAVVFGFIISGLICKAAPQTMAYIKNRPVLVQYARRIHDAYFPDYELWD